MQPELDLVGLPGPKRGRDIRLPFQRVDKRQRIAGGLRGTGRGMRPRDERRVAHQRDASRRLEDQRSASGDERPRSTVDQAEKLQNPALPAHSSFWPCSTKISTNQIILDLAARAGRIDRWTHAASAKCAAVGYSR